MPTPYGLWSLDENPAQHNTTLGDSGSGGNAATLVTNDGSTNKSVAGHIVQGIQLDGVDDYIDVANQANFTFNQTTWTFSCWIKNPPPAGGMVVAKGGLGSGGGGWLIVVDDTSIEIVHKDNAGGNAFVYDVVGLTWGDGAWHLLTVLLTFDTVTSGNNAAAVYVDAVQKTGSPTNNSTPSTSTSTLKWGVRGTVGNLNSFFAGSLDDLRVYQVALSPSEIVDLYNPPPPAEPSPFACAIGV